MEGFIVPLVVAAFLICMAFVGYKKGFLKIILSLAALIVTITLSVILTPVVSEVLKENTKVYDTIYEKMEEFVSKEVSSDTPENREAQDQALSGIALPESITKTLVNNNTGESYLKLGADSLASYTAHSLTGIVINVISFIIIFIIISIVFSILMHIANIFSKIPIIRGINKIAGIAAGLLQGLVILWILGMVITACGAMSWGQSALGIIESSAFLSFIYNNNLLTMLLFSVL